MTICHWLWYAVSSTNAGSVPFVVVLAPVNGKESGWLTQYCGSFPVLMSSLWYYYNLSDLWTSIVHAFQSECHLKVCCVLYVNHDWGWGTPILVYHGSILFQAPNVVLRQRRNFGDIQNKEGGVQWFTSSAFRLVQSEYPSFSKVTVYYFALSLLVNCKVCPGASV